MDDLRFEAGEAMSADTREAPDGRSPVWLEACAVFVAMVLSAVGLSAVFSDFAWLPSVLISILVIVVVGAIFRSVPTLRATGAAVIAQCVVGLITVLLLCAPSTLILGFVPTASSFTTVIDLLSEGVSDLYATTPPAPSTPGFTAMLTIAFTLITILIDGLVADLKAPKVSGVLLLILWMIPVFFAPTQVQWWHVVAILAAFLLLILSPYFPAAKWRSGLTATAAGALAVAIGIGAPVLLPEVPTLPDRAASDKGDLTVTNPFLDLRADLGDRDDSVLFDYSTTDDEGQPIRLTSINSFDGQTWAPTPFPLDAFAIANEGLPWPEGLPRDKNYSEERINVTVSDEYDQQYLPTPYAPQQPTGLDRRWIYDEKSLTIVGNGEKSGGQDYSMDYLSVNPNVSDLQNSTPVDSSDFETELEVPESLPNSVQETAEEVTAGAENQWEAAVMLQAYFRGGDFEYSLDAPEKASGDAISDFLADKQGYCVQFSSAMTVMARTMGIPARIGVGFGEGTENGDRFDVSMQDSHAWPELYFEDAGWVRFEPTPGGPAGEPPKWTVASGSTGEDSEEESEETSSPSDEPTEGSEESDAGESESPSEEETTAAAEPAGTNIGTYLWSGLIVLVILLLAAIPALWRLILRRRRTRDPENLEAVWTEVRALSTDYGQSLDPSRTLRFNELVLANKAGGATEESEAPSEAPSGESAPETSGAARDTGDGFTALRSPAPSSSSHSADRDTPLAAFIDALENRRYGASEKGISAVEVSALIDEVRTDLAEDASPGARITARIWPASIFNPPR
ncbi:transglutaminaseTgpA domain-containing protein [Brevibacterium marinum]|uniref:Transglutaminase-like putative cysteine protease/type II secretory pathway pseudopilin PulG n=1 Tax=Brevibacterium marinum TaxID=418643 RepID=A0A846S2A6_9MICO|nr:DUF3488 and transglutaminase-like domain-containing protein [Brevibacterium marinum]NJC57158.1 transglutaminase-like putative cysteine protease/type II secretory pathway pseudopilin PulG [Brevibacterium marinum]